MSVAVGGVSWRRLASHEAAGAHVALVALERHHGSEADIGPEELRKCADAGLLWMLGPGPGPGSGSVAGVAGLGDDGAFLCALPGLDDRQLDDGLSLLAPGLVTGGTPLWLPADDPATDRAARRAGLHRAYVDLTMRRPLPEPGPPARPPEGTRLVERHSSPGLDREVHDLVCRAWGVAPHWDGFRRRFLMASPDPAPWVLLSPTAGGPRLVAAALGRVEVQSDGGRVGEVAHLDVDPDHRRRGLAGWVLEELLRRFAALPGDVRPTSARLGVHQDNASGAPAFYLARGWRTVARHARWER